MRPSTRYAFSAVLLLCWLSTSVQAQSISQPGKNTLSTISGKITIKGKPAVGIPVGLRRSPNSRNGEVLPRGVTDQEGNYNIINVAPGSYAITAGSAIYVAESDIPRIKALNIAEGENVEGIDFSLVKGGVITGRVVDSEGHPAIEEEVMFFRVEDSNARQGEGRRIYQNAGAITDDRGIYRAFGLIPGKYKVSVGRDDQTSSGLNSRKVAFKQSFYPDSFDPEKPGIVEVGEGTQTQNIDIKLGAPIQTYSASGRVVDSGKNLSTSNVTILIQRMRPDRQGSEFLNSPVVSTASGEFTAEKLIPGKYAMNVRSGNNSEIRAEPVTFEIIDQDVTGIVLVLTQGGTISGTVVLEREDKVAFAKLQQMRVYGFVPNRDGPITSQSSSSMIGPEGSFRLAAFGTGKVNLRMVPLSGMNYMNAFNIVRIEQDGQPVQGGIEIKEGEQVSGVRIVVSYGSATLRGTINYENGTFPENGGVFIRISRSGEPNSNIQPPQVDSRGRFLLENISPGTYELEFNVYAPNLKQIRPTRQQVTVTDGSVTNLSVTIDLAPKPQP